jgi:hypothetical protein
MNVPELIKAGDKRVQLGAGIFSASPEVDCRVVSEDLYQAIIDKFIKAHNKELQESDLDWIKDFLISNIREKKYFNKL